MNIVYSALRGASVLTCSSLLVLACESSSTGDAPAPNADAGTTSGADAPDRDGGAPAEPSCIAPTGPGTTHTGDIAADEVWTAAAGPHVVTGILSVRNGRTLTIEPCAEVVLDPKAVINVAFPGTHTGTLVAEGTAKRPISFRGRAGARWASLAVHAPGTARLAHVTFANGGGGDFQEGATLAAYGDGEDGSDPIVFADHVTIDGSLGLGAWLSRGASFVKGSRDLTIRASGSDEAPYPIAIEEHAIDTLPTGSYTGNRKDEILLDPAGGKMGGSGLLESATLHDRGVPYHVGRSVGDNFRIGGRPDGALVTLTIEPGVVMRFAPQASLRVQHFVTEALANAALRAVGTADKPIVLTSASDTPAAGDWAGIWYGGIPRADNALEHVRIEYAGYSCGCILLTCSAITSHDAAIVFTGQPPSAFVKNTVFANIAGNAINQGFDGAFVDFRGSNTFEGVAGCPQTLPRDPVNGCPAPKPACDQ